MTSLTFSDALVAAEPTALYSAHPQIASSDIPDGMALLDMRTGKYYGLNIVGAYIWNFIKSPVPVQPIVTAICEKFNVEYSICHDDITNLLATLHEAGLVEITSP